MSLEEYIQGTIAGENAVRSAAPPVALEPGAFVEPPSPMSADEHKQREHHWYDGVAHGLGVVGKGALAPLTFAADKLDRGDSAFRATLLTAIGKIPADKYPEYMKEVFEGKRRVSGEAFMEAVVGTSLWEQLNATNAVPGWVKTVVASEGERAQVRPRVSVGNVLGKGAEFFVSPWAAFSALPEKAFINLAAKGGALGAVGRGLETATQATTWPMRKIAANMTSPDTPWGAWIMQALDPNVALRAHGEAVVDIAEGASRVKGANALANNVLRGLGKAHVGVWKDPAKKEELWDYLTHKTTAKLAPDVQAAADDIMTQVIKPRYHLARQMNDTADELGYSSYTIKKRGPGGVVEKRVVEWDPDKKKLSQFVPTLRGELPIAGSIGEKTLKRAMSVNVGWRKKKVDFAAIKSDQKDLDHLLLSWMGNMDRKLILEERYRGVKIAEGITRNSEGKFVPSGTHTAEWDNKGVISKWAPTAHWGQPGQNPRLKDFKAPELLYLNHKIRDFTFNSVGRREITADNVGMRFWTGIDKMVGSAAQKTRITNYFYGRSKKLATDYGFPAFTKAQSVTSVMAARIMIATLGENLSSAIHNMSQAVNIATAKGVYPTLKGVLKMNAAWTEDARTFKELRKMGELNNQFRHIIYDELWPTKLKRTFDDIHMGPFNIVENQMRGLAFTVQAGEELEKLGIKSASELGKRMAASRAQGAEFIHLNRIVQSSKRLSDETNFIYGVGGKSSWMMGPAQKLAFGLQSYSWKEAAFLAKTWRKDGSAMIRWFALNGWIIDSADKLAGVNAESWLGWGFLPPNTLGRGPAVQAATNMIQFALGHAEGNTEAVKEASNNLRGNIREIFRAFGLEDDVPESAQTAIAAMTMMGMTPMAVPLVGIARSAKAFNEFMTGKREDREGKTFQRVGKEEALKSWFFTTHRQHSDAQLRSLTQQARTQVDAELEKRAKKYVSALRGKDGDEVRAAARALATPINLRFATASQPAVRALSFRLGDEQSFWPHGEMISNRLERIFKQQTVSRDVLDMHNAGWTMDIYYAEYVQRALAELERGAIIPLVPK